MNKKRGENILAVHPSIFSYERHEEEKRRDLFESIQLHFMLI